MTTQLVHGDVHAGRRARPYHGHDKPQDDRKDAPLPLGTFYSFALLGWGSGTTWCCCKMCL